MADKVIPLADHRYVARVPTVPLNAAPPTGLIGDVLGRPLRDLRISVTDRCNFRCSYCMPKEVPATKTPTGHWMPCKYSNSRIRPIYCTFRRIPLRNPNCSE